jgi:hypothetical protein
MPGHASDVILVDVLIDRYMPEFQFSERHSTYVDAPRDDVFRALEALTAREVPSFSVLMGLRSLPSRLKGEKVIAPEADRPLLDQMMGTGFKVLVRYPPNEGVLGVVGKFWKVRALGEMRDFGEPKDFYDFREPGYTKAVMNFHVWPEGQGSTLSTETRVLATDEATRRKFAVYWRMIQPGSAVIRRGMLKAVKERAEATAGAA